MKHSKNIILLSSIVSLFLAFTFTKVHSWKVKQPYQVKVYRNDQIEYPIYFSGLKATIEFDKQQVEKSSIVATIDAASINTGFEEMNNHAKEPGILNSAMFPLITLQSTAISKTASGFGFVGKLTIKGITKEVKFPFAFEKETFTGKFNIVAKEFNILSKDAVPSGIIKIELTIPVKKR